MVKCKDKCRGLFMQLDHAVGDVDMYGKEGGFPQILNNNCPSRECPCRSRTRGTDNCEIPRAESNSFFLVLVVDKPHLNLTLQVEAFNLDSVTPVS